LNSPFEGGQGDVLLELKKMSNSAAIKTLAQTDSPFEGGQGDVLQSV